MLDRDVLLEKIRETVALGGDQILMQGGLHPHLKLEWYEELLHDIKAHFPAGQRSRIQSARDLSLHQGGQAAVAGGARAAQGRRAGQPARAAGAEILVDRVRSEITRGKVMTDDWLNVNRVWHELGGRSTATMMFGHIETIEERVEHFERVRQLQDETGGFTAFISWTFQPDHTDMADVPAAGAFEYLKNQAISRLYLDNVPEHPVVVGDSGAQDRPGRALFRGQRHGQPDDRGKCRVVGRNGLSPVARGDQASHSRGGLHSSPT